jgi:hypothetical protein
MTGDTSGPDQDDRSRNPTEEDLNRLLLEEFYEDSVARYGPDSAQARLLLRLLHPGDFPAPKKSD